MQLLQTISSRNTFFFKIHFIAYFLFDSNSMCFTNYVHINIFEIACVLWKLNIFLWKLSWEFEHLGSWSICRIYITKAETPQCVCLSVCVSVSPQTPPKGLEISSWNLGLWWEITRAMFLTILDNIPSHIFPHNWLISAIFCFCYQ